MNSDRHILKKLLLKWRIILLVNVCLTALGAVMFSYFLIAEGNVFVSILAFIIGGVFGYFIFKPFNVDFTKVTSWIDKVLPQAENSAFLLSRAVNTSPIAQLQRSRVSKIIEAHYDHIPWPASIKPGLIALFVLASLGYSLKVMIENNRLIPDQKLSAISFESVNNTSKREPIKVTQQQVTINYPNYTGLKSLITADMNITALEGSIIKWDIGFNIEPEQLYMELNTGKRINLKSSENRFYGSFKLIENGYYKLIYSDKDSTFYESDLYPIKMVIDQPPLAEIIGIERFNTFEYSDAKNVSLDVQLSDDYGLKAAEFVATVSKGSGESVKFREERLPFDQNVKIGANSQQLNKTINLDKMNMTPGDELYFYVETFDNKFPKANRSVTQTYFITIRDTTEITFSLEGSLGVDLMPEYFRSQRQIIIDTEKLIKERGKIKEHEFNNTSNELGFDQKSLRLKYGQFMGEEFETGITESSIPPEEEDHDHDHDHEGEEHDPLEEYSHNHDHENEHNLVPEEEKEEDPLEEYKHSHDDPEEATLYTISIKGKLRAAMAEMWDAELYLRLYEPEKSLPYQYKALELIKEIKNHARIYVHRMGFDPPPIKEESRLTGDIDKVESLTLASEVQKKAELEGIKNAIQYIDQLLIEENPKIIMETIEGAGVELAKLAIDDPIKYFEPLQLLQSIRTNIDGAWAEKHPILVQLQQQLHLIMKSEQSKLSPLLQRNDQLSEEYFNVVKESFQ